MTSPDRTTNPLADAVAGDLLAVVRRYEPAWTGSNQSDPGVTLLEIGAWIADRIATAGTFVSPTVSGTATRPDPYGNFNFRVQWDGAVVGGVSRISALRRTVAVVEHREGGAPGTVNRLPGRVTHEPFAMERPLGADTRFEDWARQVGGQTAGAAWRKDVRIEILDHAGRLFLAYDVYGCWPAGYRILPELTESLTLVPEGWQRDRSVTPGA